MGNFSYKERFYKTEMSKEKKELLIAYKTNANI